MGQHTILQYQDFFDKNFSEFAAYEFESQGSKSIGGMLCAERIADALVMKTSELSGLGIADETGLYDAPTPDSPTQGYDSSVTIKKFTKSVQIPKAVWLPLEKGGQRAAEYLVRKFEQEGEASALAQAFWDRIDTDVADKVNRGTSLTTPDGVALFSTQHPVNPVLSTTYNSNYTSGASLTATTVGTLLELVAQCSARNNQPANLTAKYPVYLMGPNELQDPMIRIAATMGASQSWPGSANNDMNALQAMGLQSKPIVWPRLSTRYDTNGSTSAWYLAIPGLTFKIFWLEKITFHSWVQPITGTYTFAAEAWFNIQISDFRGMWKA